MANSTNDSGLIWMPFGDRDMAYSWEAIACARCREAVKHLVVRGEHLFCISCTRYLDTLGDYADLVSLVEEVNDETMVSWPRDSQS